MTRISEHRSVLVIVAASALLFAHGDTRPVNAENRSNAPDARQIIASSIAATERHWQARRHYTYLARDESRRRDPAGRVKSEDVDVSRTILVNGIPFEQLVERNGQPPSVEEEWKQRAELMKLNRDTPGQRAERLHKQAEENMSLMREVPKAFDFQLVGEDVINGRPAYVLQATTHPGYQARGIYGKMLSKVEGKLWVDKQDFGWTRVDGQVIQSFSMKLFLVQLMRGSQITMEQTRLDDGIWMPERVEVRAAAKVFFVKSLVIDRVLTYSEYRLADPGASSTRDPLVP